MIIERNHMKGGMLRRINDDEEEEIEFLIARHKGGNIWSELPGRLGGIAEDIGKDLSARKDIVQEAIKSKGNEIVQDIVQKVSDKVVKPVGTVVSSSSDLINEVSKKFINNLLEGKPKQKGSGIAVI